MKLELENTDDPRNHQFRGFRTNHCAFEQSRDW